MRERLVKSLVMTYLVVFRREEARASAMDYMAKRYINEGRLGPDEDCPADHCPWRLSTGPDGLI